MGRRLRNPVGHVFYFAVPPGDRRFSFPHMPSFGVPGCTGWPALPPDNRGFRVRAGSRPAEDPDTSDRWIPPEAHERPREILERHFPELVGAPLNETRACHYEMSVDENFIVDRHPDFDNVWLLGGGSGRGVQVRPGARGVRRPPCPRRGGRPRSGRRLSPQGRAVRRAPAGRIDTSGSAFVNTMPPHSS